MFFKAYPLIINLRLRHLRPWPHPHIRLKEYLMEILILGVVLSFNILIILWKFRNNRLADGLADAFLLLGVTIVFSGSTALLSIGAVGSMIIAVIGTAYLVYLFLIVAFVFGIFFAHLAIQRWRSRWN